MFNDGEGFSSTAILFRYPDDDSVLTRGGDNHSNVIGATIATKKPSTVAVKRTKYTMGRVTREPVSS